MDCVKMKTRLIRIFQKIHSAPWYAMRDVISIGVIKGPAFSDRPFLF